MKRKKCSKYLHSKKYMLMKTVFKDYALPPPAHQTNCYSEIRTISI